MLKAWLAELVAWYLAALDTGGYPLIALLMAIESSVVPLPSEVVIPPAAHLAATQKFSANSIVDVPALAGKLKAPKTPLDTWLAGQLTPTTTKVLQEYQGAETNTVALKKGLTDDLNKLLETPSIYHAQRFTGVSLRPQTQKLLAQNPQGDDLIRLNRLLVEDAYPTEFSRKRLNMLGIVIAGAFGSWVGAAVMYWISRIAGRPFILRYGKYFFIRPEKVHGAERWAAQFGTWGILVSRFLPVVRHLIGIPAGVVKMNFKFYTISTLIGSAFWCAILCVLGVKMGADEKVLEGNVRQIGLWVGGILIGLGLMYYFLVHRFMKKGPVETSSPEGDQPNN